MKSPTVSSFKTGAICAVLLLALSGCEQDSVATGPPGKVEVTAAKPLVMTIVEWDEYTGRLDAIESVEVRARVSGYLQSTYFEEGQMVERGDLLAIIDPRPFEAALNAANAKRQEAEARLAESQSLLRQAEAEKADREAQLTLADRRLDRARRLLPSRAVTEEEFDIRKSEQLQATAALEAANAMIESAKAGIATSQAAITTAEANVESAALDLQYTRVRAPIGGRISRRYVTDGNLISGGTSQSALITTIVSLNPIHCYFDANEQEFLKYSRLAKDGTRGSSRNVKNPVHVALVDEQGFPHTGHMDFVDNRIDPNTGTMRGRAILPNDDGLLTPGLFVRLRLPGSGRKETVLVPDSAIGSDQSDKFVYLIGESNSVVRRAVTLGPISHGLRIIRSGLDGTEMVVTRGLQRIYPGVEVSVTETTIEAEESELPDDYEPVPREQWLSRTPPDAPDGIEETAKPYREPQNGAPRGAGQE